MSLDHRGIGFLGLSSAGWVALALAVVSASVVVVRGRRRSVVVLMLQYALVGLLVGPQLHRSVMLMRFGIGFAVCLILYITSGRPEPEPGRRRSRPDGVRDLRSVLGSAPGSSDLAGVGLIFRVLAMVLGSLTAYGLWRTYPLPSAPAGYDLMSYWLASMGLIQILISIDPLRVGVGLLTVTSGVQAIYLSWEPGLLVIGLIGIVDVLMSLAIAYTAAIWLESPRPETTGQ